MIIKEIIINNMDFDESYNEAIAKKSQAIQEQQEQAIRNQTSIDQAKAEAEAERQRAQGQADAELIQAQAKAEANRIISESITEATQRQDAIDRWNGELPRTPGRGCDFWHFGVRDLHPNTQDHNDGCALSLPFPAPGIRPDTQKYPVEGRHSVKKCRPCG